MIDQAISFRRDNREQHILIVDGIGFAALGITAGILLRCGPFGYVHTFGPAPAAIACSFFGATGLLSVFTMSMLPLK
jgi:hypothetical protein